MMIKLLLLLYLKHMYSFSQKINRNFLFLRIVQFLLLYILGTSNGLSKSQLTSINQEIKISITGCTTLGYCINIDSDVESAVEIILDLDTTGTYEQGGIDVKLTGNLKIGKNCIPWDGFNGKGITSLKTLKANIICIVASQQYLLRLSILPLCAPVPKDDKDSTIQNIPLIVKDTRILVYDQVVTTNGNKPHVQPQVNGATSKGGIINMDTLGHYTYSPPKNFVGLDEFSYTICYKNYPDLCGTAMIRIKVLSAGFETPVGKNDYYTIKQNQEKTGDVRENDMGGKLCKYSIGTVLTAKGGKITMASNGSFTYSPPPDFVGKDSISYEMCNIIVPELCTTAWVYFTIILQKDIIVPSGFTPNNDGINDFFEIQNIEQYDNEVKIFNRWGSLVYQAINYNNKDIKWEAKSAEGAILKNDIIEGTYFFLIDLKDGAPAKNGYVIIIK